jgi:hypothetical protein
MSTSSKDSIASIHLKILKMDFSMSILIPYFQNNYLQTLQKNPLDPLLSASRGFIYLKLLTFKKPSPILVMVFPF